jgi:hypothetical protein
VRIVPTARRKGAVLFSASINWVGVAAGRSAGHFPEQNTRVDAGASVGRVSFVVKGWPLSFSLPRRLKFTRSTWARSCVAASIVELSPEQLEGHGLVCERQVVKRSASGKHRRDDRAGRAG